jgi:hypothetical protein
MARDPLGYVDGMSLYAGYHVMYGGVDYEGTKSWKNNDPLNISFLGVNPLNLTYAADGNQYINLMASHTFRSKQLGSAKDVVLNYFDIDGDGQLSKTDCPPFKLGISGYSWGGWTALKLAHSLSQDFEIHMGLVDPINTLRIKEGTKRERNTGPRGPKSRSKASDLKIGTKPKNVVKSENYYQTLGCSNNCVGQSAWYRSQAIRGFDVNIDMSPTLSEGDAHVAIVAIWGKNAAMTAHQKW